MAVVVFGNFGVENSPLYTYFHDPESPWVTIQYDANTVTHRSDKTGAIEHYYGNFQYDNSGNVVGGTVTGYDELYNGQYVSRVTDWNVPAKPVFDAITTDNYPQLQEQSLGGDDSITCNIYDDKIYSLGGNDTVIALDGQDYLDGGAGNDDINGNKGQDTVHGGEGADLVRGGQGNDAVFGDDGDDPHVNGNLGDDIVHGGNGNDTVFGGQGNDQLFGDAGNDYLSGDLGNDVMTGGAGADTFHFGPNSGRDYVYDFNFADGDHVLLDHGATYTVSQSGADTLVTLGTGDVLVLLGVDSSSLPSGWLLVS